MFPTRNYIILLLVFYLSINFSFQDEQITIPLSIFKTQDKIKINLHHRNPFVAGQMSVVDLDINSKDPWLEYLVSSSDINTTLIDYGFSIDFYQRNLYLGNIIEDPSLSYKHLHKLPVIENKGDNTPLWQINLKGIFLGNFNIRDENKNFRKNLRKDGSEEKIFNIDKTLKGGLIEEPFIFDTTVNELFAKKIFFDFLDSKNYFSDSQNNTICRRHTYINGLEKDITKQIEVIYYTCYRNKIDELQNINLIFDDDYIVILDKKDLISCVSYSQECEFNIRYDYLKDKYVFGLFGLKNFRNYYMINDKGIYLENDQKIFKGNFDGIKYDYVEPK